MSQVSPDGKFVVTSIDEPGGWEKIDAPATEFYRLFDISAQLADKKQFDAAVLGWNKALVFAPGDPRGHNNLDSALAEAGRVDEALPEFEESVELNPDSDAAGVNLGNALAAKGGHLEEAIQQLNQGIELQPESASAQNGLGVALAPAGRLEDAVVQMDKAVVLAPQAVDYRYNFACVLAANDSRPRAVVQFEEAARLWNAGTCNSGDACGYLFRDRTQFQTL